MNLFLGWTFLGWVLALVWALSDSSGRATHQAIHQTVVVNTAAHAVMPPTIQHTYQVGDVVNGHRFNGSAWVPVTGNAPIPGAPIADTPTTGPHDPTATPRADQSAS